METEDLKLRLTKWLANLDRLQSENTKRYDRRELPLTNYRDLCTRYDGKREALWDVLQLLD